MMKCPWEKIIVALVCTYSAAQCGELSDLDKLFRVVIIVLPLSRPRHIISTYE